MDAPKVGLGVLLLAASGLAIQVAGQPGARVPLVLAGLAAVGLTAAVLADDADGRRLGQ